MTAVHVRFPAVVFDVDSTLTAIEGVDWLAARRGSAVASRVRALTRRAMAGEVPLERVYAERLEAVAPSRDDLAALGRAYVAALAPGAAAVVGDLDASGVRVELVSGGLRPAVLALAASLRIPEGRVHAVNVRFDERGAYAGFDAASPLTSAQGKAGVLRSLALPRPTLAVGDGSTDVAMRTAGGADAFAAFVGFVRRDIAVAAADYVVTSLADVRALVLERDRG